MSKKTEHVDGKNGENKEGRGGRRRRERVVESVETRTGRGVFFGERENRRHEKTILATMAAAAHVTTIDASGISICWSFRIVSLGTNLDKSFIQVLIWFLFRCI